MIVLAQELVFGMIIFALGLTYLCYTTRAKIVGVISMIPLFVLAFHFANFASLGFVALALFNGYYAFWGRD